MKELLQLILETKTKTLPRSSFLEKEPNSSITHTSTQEKVRNFEHKRHKQTIKEEFNSNSQQLLTHSIWGSKNTLA